MQFEIVGLNDDSIHVHAPLAPNVNIHGTGFAGSIYSLAVLTGWAMVSYIMELHGIEGDLVVGKAEIKYRLPVTGDIDCRCLVNKMERQVFIDRFKQHRKSKLELSVIVGENNNAVLTGGYFVVG